MTGLFQASPNIFSGFTLESQTRVYYTSNKWTNYFSSRCKKRIRKKKKKIISWGKKTKTKKEKYKGYSTGKSLYSLNQTFFFPSNSSRKKKKEKRGKPVPKSKLFSPVNYNHKFMTTRWKKQEPWSHAKASFRFGAVRRRKMLNAQDLLCPALSIEL